MEAPKEAIEIRARAKLTSTPACEETVDVMNLSRLSEDAIGRQGW